MYVRKISRTWETSDGKKKERNYYYWYKSKRIGEKVISECIGPATKEDYIKSRQDKE